MSSEVAISVQGLSKSFHIYSKPRDRLKQMVVRSRKKYFKEFWALRDISFDIMKGETVGIVGRNGSGKSTLLQLICGTLNPSGGNIQTDGRIAALLELGSGFNPEFTGHENVFMYAAVLGLSHAETEQRYDEIVEFSGIKDFIHQPVKTYSSGMVVRLAFSVAINVDPQILVVDEALSVGDELFQRKCFAKIESVKQRGTTILFVSHSGGTVIELCDRAILLDAGELIRTGRPKKIIGQYHKLLYSSDERRQEIISEIRNSVDETPSAEKETHLAKRLPAGESLVVAADGEETFDPDLIPSSTIDYESKGARIRNARIESQQGAIVNGLIRGRTYNYCFTVDFEKAATSVRFGMMIKTRVGMELGGAISAPSLSGSIPSVRAGESVEVKFAFTCSLNMGAYFLNAGALGVPLDGEETYLHRLLDACMFRVLPEANDFATGTIDFKCIPSTNCLETN